MVMPMVGRPPQHAFLRGCHGEERQEKLEDPAGFERAMGKIAVISRRDRNHSQIVAGDSEQNPFPSNPGLKGHEAHQMDAEKWNDVAILDKILPGPGYGGTVGMMGRSVHTEIVAPSAMPRVVTVGNLSLNYPLYNMLITSAVRYRSWLARSRSHRRAPEAVTFSDLHGLL